MALLGSASACDFDERSNPAYGCVQCEAPSRCVDNFCIRSVDLLPLPDAAPTELDAAQPVEECEPESCNDVDDDCDGTIDEQLTRDARVCVAGRYVCNEFSSSVAERCDGVDNDCDGLSDEGFDLTSDPLHCGGCGSACADTERCCDGSCVDPTHDDDHCGACGVRCSRGTTCCGGACVDPTSDSDHCGGCDQRCAGTGTCCGGQCVDAQTDRDHCGPFCLRCAEGAACCFGACADLDSFQHCGSCERVCGSGELCCSGSCTTSLCE